MNINEREKDFKVQLSGDLKVIMSNPTSKHNYFAWPSVVRLQNGKIAVGASGYRLSHICPFGKTVMSISEDEGESYSAPTPIIDTVLDDRDAGLCTFGEKGLIITSFNNTAEYQRDVARSGRVGDVEYRLAYINTIAREEEQKYLGNIFRISNDCGVTFGEIYHSPVSSPHGPVQLSDGTVLWVGRVWQPEDRIEAHKINTADGTTEFVGYIENIFRDGEKLLSCEPHAVQLSNGEILCHIRVQNRDCSRIFTIYQSKSADGGRTWSKPVQILEDLGGAPSHLLQHSSGTLIATYGRRILPYGIRAMFSKDNGETWDTEHIIFENTVNLDIGYPATVELKDGSLMTVFYAYLEEGEPSVICQQKWRFE